MDGAAIRTSEIGATASDDRGSFRAVADTTRVADFVRGQTANRINVMVESLAPTGEFAVYGRVFIVTSPTKGTGYFETDADADGVLSIPPTAGTSQAAALPPRAPSHADASGLHLRLAKGTPEQTATAQRVAKVGPSSPQGATPIVSSKFVKYLGEAKTLVGQGASTTGGGGFTFDFTYTTGASSSLGVAVSNTAVGGYSASGTSSVTTSASQDYPTWSNLGFHYNRTDMSWGLYLINADSMYFPAYYLSKAYKVTGGVYTQNVTSSIPAYTKCKPYPAGSGLTKTTERAITWSNGVYVGSGVNLSLSTNTGYTAQASVRIAIKTSRHICGSAGYPLEAGAYVLEVRG